MMSKHSKNISTENSCCSKENTKSIKTQENKSLEGGCDTAKKEGFWAVINRMDPIYKLSILAVSVGYLSYFLGGAASFERFSQTIFSIMNAAWWSILLGILMVGVLEKIPRKYVVGVLGRRCGRRCGTCSIRGIFRATLAGCVLDLCNHGVLMIGAKLYQRGATLGQTFAFLISTPWNSFSMVILMMALIGWKWTLVFIVLSMVVGFITGLIVDYFMEGKVIANNPNRIELEGNFSFWQEARVDFKGVRFDRYFFKTLLKDGYLGSKMILKWIFFGIALTGFINSAIDTQTYKEFFGPTLSGLGLTLVFATIVQTCSEGSSPVGADLVTRALAPGNGFTFMMAGASTDYTEILILRGITKSWKTALLLPALTVFQILLLGYMLNHFHA